MSLYILLQHFKWLYHVVIRICLLSGVEDGFECCPGSHSFAYMNDDFLIVNSQK